MLQAEGITTLNKGRSAVSAVKTRTRPRKGRPGANVHWKRIINGGDDLQKALKASPELQSVITRHVLYGHMTPLEGQAAKRLAYIVARFERHFVEQSRTARSPSYERAFRGEDQELERLALEPFGIADYEAEAKKAKRQYNRLQAVLLPYGAQAKAIIDDMCCADVEPPAQFRDNISVVLRAVAKEFGVTVEPRRRARR